MGSYWDDNYGVITKDKLAHYRLLMFSKTHESVLYIYIYIKLKLITAYGVPSISH